MSLSSMNSFIRYNQPGHAYREEKLDLSQVNMSKFKHNGHEWTYLINFIEMWLPINSLNSSSLSLSSDGVK